MKRYYIKDSNGDFKEAGHEFTGFPANGIWLVEDGKQSCLTQLSNITKAPLLSSDFLTHKEDLLNFILDKSKENDGVFSMSNISSWSCEYFAKTSTVDLKNDNDAYRYKLSIKNMLNVLSTRLLKEQDEKSNS